MKDIYEYITNHNFPNNYNILEAGCHLGTDTKKLSKYFFEGKIYGFEPNKNLFGNILKPLQIEQKNVEIFNLALSNTDGITSFYLDENPQGDSGASSLLKSEDFYLKDYIKKETEIEVESITMSTWMKKFNVFKIDFIWLDLEGYEYYVISNAINEIKNVKYIYLEVNFNKFRKGTYLYDDIKKLLESMNFEEKYKWSQGGEWGTWQGNVLYGKRNE